MLTTKRRGKRGEAFMAAGGHSPEEWLEEHVAAIIAGDQVSRVIGRLEGVSGWGISLTIPLNEEGQPTETTVFYPWHRVESLRPAREEEYPS
jgi:hypothetical protein